MYELRDDNDDDDDDDDDDDNGPGLSHSESKTLGLKGNQLLNKAKH